VSRVALLDVNVLLALSNPKHTHHETAHDWFADHNALGWATCAITQNGFIRVLSNPAAGAGAFRPGEVVDLLRRFCSAKEHVFWADTISLTDNRLFNPSLIRGYRQVSDIYLLGLAKKMGGYLATFDAGIPLGAVVGATRDTITVISTGDSDE
jgi:toxin-antitoxin system PIN domain toxin